MIVPSRSIVTRWSFAWAQVEKAITKDFGHKGDDIQTTIHPFEKTTSYIVVVDELIPDSGKATISYILGYKSESLMQVSVVWGTVVEPEATLDKLRETVRTQAKPMKTTTVAPKYRRRVVGALARRLAARLAAV